MAPKPFEIDFEIPPPLTEKEIAKKYGVSKAFIRKLDRVLPLPESGRSQIDRTVVRRGRTKTGARKK